MKDGHDEPYRRAQCHRPRHTRDRQAARRVCLSAAVTSQRPNCEAWLPHCCETVTTHLRAQRRETPTGATLDVRPLLRFPRRSLPRCSLRHGFPAPAVGRGGGGSRTRVRMRLSDGSPGAVGIEAAGSAPDEQCFPAVLPSAPGGALVTAEAGGQLRPCRQVD